MRRPAFPSLCVVLAMTPVIVLAIPTHAQDPESSVSSVDSQITEVKAENAALREQLRKLEEHLNKLQQQFDAASAPTAKPDQAIRPTSDTDAQTLPPSANSPPVHEATSPTERVGGRWDDGMVIAKTPDTSSVPFLLKLNDITQFRYTNTQPVSSTFTDHLGQVRPVEARNDFSLNRNLIMFNGYVFDKRLQFNLITWASNSLASVIAGGLVSYEFSKGFSAYAGYWSVPGSRTLTGSFPYFIQLDRSLADNFFRPGFTQGVWVAGQPVKAFNYHVFLGNGLNTLTIPTTKIDTNLVASGSVWWEPLGPYGPPGRGRNMFDDYDFHKTPAIRIGTSYTRSREDRFSNLDQNNPENTSLYNSDGVLTFATGAFAPDVTLQEATYRMWALDAGIKWRGVALNGQFYSRWLNSFVADGPLPLSSTFDRGFETELSGFVVPQKFELYGRTSFVFGQFGDSHEYAAGFKWYPVANYRVWIVGEALRVNETALGSIITPYTAGLTGWEPLLQFMFNF